MTTCSSTRPRQFLKRLSNDLLACKATRYRTKRSVRPPPKLTYERSALALTGLRASLVSISFQRCQFSVRACLNDLEIRKHALLLRQL